MLDEAFVADCPYVPEALLFDEILQLDREAGRVVARMPTHDRLPFTALQRAHPERHPRHVSGAVMVHVTAMLGLAHAYLSHRDDAVREGERALALAPARDGQSGIGMQANLAGIYSILGEPEKAIDRIERLMTVPSGWTREWLKNGPFAPLRGNPRFERLVASK